ncbi:asparagine synthetase B family protein [Bradyrhizobium valentinum]|uniref:asparagine synthetase B family protein n=1 Tax=Bradyrhizobium valentinum TaxID=1518501 RepID=UPI0018D23E0B|nr:asparagine synthase-related protein [Bradyrhizobium valentinum]
MGRLLQQPGAELQVVRHGSVHFGIQGSSEIGVQHLGDTLVACAGYMLTASGLPASARDIADGYRRQGVQFFDDLDGHYSIAIWDASLGTLLLARDPFGVMPLAFAHGENWSAFATEYKALLALSQITSEPDLPAINTFFYNGWAPPGRTFFKDIRPVLPGSAVMVGVKGLKVVRTKPRAYDYDEPRNPAKPRDVLGVIEKSVNSYAYDATLRYGVSLSGGVDSALITALLRKRLPEKKLWTFTVGYGDSDPDIIGARQTSSLLETSHREFIVRPRDLIEILPSTVWCLEDPGGYDAFAHLYALARGVAGRADVLFSGNICDTLFGGMPEHRRLWLGTHLSGAKKILSELRSAELSGTLPASWPTRAIWYATRGRNPAPAPCSTPVEGSRLVADQLELADRHSPLFQMLCSAVMSWDNRMGAQEALAAEFGLKFRMPYANKHLIDLALRIPDAQKVGPRQVKVILRRAAELVLPRAITHRKKYIQQFPYDSEMADVIDHLCSRLINPHRSRRFTIVNNADVRRLLRRRARTYKDIEVRWLWNAITAEIWAQQFIDRREAFLSDKCGDIGPISI